MSTAVSEPAPYGVQVPGLKELRRYQIAEPSALVSKTAWVGLCVLILVAPFEETRPLIQLPGQSLSSVEAALLMVFGAWVASMAWSRSLPRRTVSTLMLPWIALILVMLVSAWSAPTNRVNALHMLGRTGLALGVYLLTVNAITSAGRVSVLFSAAAAAGALVAALAILEYAGVQPVLNALRLFRPGTTLVGAQIRATGPFQYPTIASMYLEILFAFVSGLLLVAIDAGRRKTAVAIALALVIMGEAITLTFTRAGILTLASSLAIIGALRYRGRGLDAGVKALAAIAAIVAIQLLTSRSFEMLRLRLTTEGAAWYTATFEVPSDLPLSTGATVNIPVTVTNTGATTWDPEAPQPFRLSYHWLLANDDVAINWEGLRTPFPSRITPGETVSLVARVRAPDRPGQYRLLWDIEEMQRRWFSSEPDTALFMTRATVSGPATSAQPPKLVALPRKADRPGRLVLWRAAVRMLAERPLRGVGPDNFRLLYGPYAGLSNADPRVHSNNMYLEILVGGGALAGAALAWLLWSAARSFRALARRMAPPIATLSAAVLAAGAAVALHGLVDSFLSFTATYMLIAVTLGLASACAALGKPHANRV